MKGERRLRWDATTGRVAIEFPYDNALVALVRELPGRRWDPARKTWWAPLDAASEALRVLEPRGFVVDPELKRRVEVGAPRRRDDSLGRDEEIDYPEIDDAPPLEILDGSWEWAPVASSPHPDPEPEPEPDPAPHPRPPPPTTPPPQTPAPTPPAHPPT